MRPVTECVSTNRGVWYGFSMGVLTTPLKFHPDCGVQSKVARMVQTIIETYFAPGGEPSSSPAVDLAKPNQSWDNNILRTLRARDSGVRTSAQARRMLERHTCYRYRQVATNSHEDPPCDDHRPYHVKN